MNNYALIKFFSTAEFKQKFLDGEVFCNTAAYFRKSAIIGVGDPQEHTIASYYAINKDQKQVKIQFGIGTTIGDNEIKLNDNVESLTLRRIGQNDSWLHCWYVIDFKNCSPSQFIENMEKMISNLGINGIYAIIIEPDDVKELIARFKRYSFKSVSYAKVKYTNKPLTIDRFTKVRQYSYQSEFRFSFGNSTENDPPYIFNVPEGFRDIARDGFWIKLEDEYGILWEKYFS